MRWLQHEKLSTDIPKSIKILIRGSWLSASKSVFKTVYKEFVTARFKSFREFEPSKMKLLLFSRVITNYGSPFEIKIKLLTKMKHYIHINSLLKVCPLSSFAWSGSFTSIISLFTTFCRDFFLIENETLGLLQSKTFHKNLNKNSRNNLIIMWTVNEFSKWNLLKICTVSN